jgi:hypothetical protein
MREKYFSDCMNTEWLASGEDPVLDELSKSGTVPSLDAIRELYPPTIGEAAFDPIVIKSNIERLVTVPEVNTGQPFLDLSVKTGLAFIDATFQGDHPKYGIKQYGESCHDGFPPTIIAAVDALSVWGLNRRAVKLFRYYLVNFVRDDGTLNYRGTSLAELGQLLHTGALLLERAGPTGWWNEGFPQLDHIAERLLGLRRQAEKDDGLLVGVPEDDQREKVGTYFHNNAWVYRGLLRWASACKMGDASPTTPTAIIEAVARSLAQDTLRVIHCTWPEDPTDWWLPPQVETLARPSCLTDTWEASYTNYRYWPELLSSDLLPRELAERIVNARLVAGGQFCGMTRFADWLDDWPLADYLFGLWRLGRKRDFLQSLYGHIAYHQAEGHLTAYEQVTFPPGKEKAAYCLPCQLVAARASRLLVEGVR